MPSKIFKSVDEYTSAQGDLQQSLLKQMRICIKKAAPNAEEVISYNMPAYKQNGIVAYYAACKNHIGFYPTSSPLVHFKKDLTPYKHSKGAVQFPLDKKLPLALITKMVKFRLQEIREKESLKKRQ